MKILLIRMLGLGDVTCIGIPAIRYLKSKYPDAEITVLSYAAGADVIALAEPDVKLMVMAKGDWPDTIIEAMQTFLVLADEIIGEHFQKIFNLDTWFMPCFLARFLKDAGEPVEGNFMSIGVDDLIRKLKLQTLEQRYVNNPGNYMDSTFLSMGRWHTPWWEAGNIPNYGYPEFYLRQCCGFDDVQMDMAISVEDNPSLTKLGNKQKVIALATQARTKERHYPFAKELTKYLEKAGFHVWSGFDGSVSMKKTLSKLKASDLLVSVPSAPQWLAKTVGCPSLIILGEVDGRTLMPEFSTEQSNIPIPAQDLAQRIISVFADS